MAACSSGEPHGFGPDAGLAETAGRGGVGGTSTSAAGAGGTVDAAPAPDAGAADDAAAPTEAGAGAVDTASADDAKAEAPAATGDAGAADSGPGAAKLVSYEAESGATFGNATTIACAACSGGARVSIPPDSGFTLTSVVAPVAGTNMLMIFFTNGDSNARSIYIGVNGSDSQLLLAVFPPTGGWGNVSSIAVPLSGFNAGSNNRIMFFIDTELGPPDLDRVALAPTAVVGNATNACDHKSWKATASVTGGDGGGPAAAVDGDLGSRWASNRSQTGADWFQVDFGALVKLYRVTLDDSQTYPNDYPSSYAVYGSLDGVTFDAKPFATGNGAYNATVINFAQRTVRAIKIVQTGARSNWWQIGELRVGCYQ